MQFITTDQRIAVENFEIGLIYTVTFTSGSYFLGACIGIGKDYVMFQRTAPELIFSLTMAAAADVASIEPLPEEIGQILEYTGSVPVSIKTDGSPLLDYLITGNTIQNGTPTPENPIMPQGTGERTGNLLPLSDKTFTITAYSSNLTVTCSGGNLYFSGTVGEIPSNYTAWKTNFAFELEAGTYYCNNPSPLGSGFGRYIKKYSDDTNFLTPSDYTFTLSETTKCYFSFYIYNKNLGTQVELMLNTGSTALPYEPYGYKIPILSNNTTTPIYLGEVETTRKIRKLVLKGTETIDTLTVTDQLLFRFNTFYTNDKLMGNAVDTLLCNVYKIVNGRAAAALAENNYSMTTYNSNTDNRLIVHDDRFTTVEDFKAYLAQQYAAGTPVTVWYVLATPETAVVNEPLMRIGNYADTLSYRQSGVNVLTTDGLNIFDIDKTVKPSEVYLKYFSPLL